MKRGAEELAVQRKNKIQKIDVAFFVPGLNEVLKANGLDTTGKKTPKIERLIDCFDRDTENFKFVHSELKDILMPPTIMIDLLKEGKTVSSINLF
jgi:hypothetical protein